jgi:hypothetical protein
METALPNLNTLPVDGWPFSVVTGEFPIAAEVSRLAKVFRHMQAYFLAATGAASEFMILCTPCGQFSRSASFGGRKP